MGVGGGAYGLPKASNRALDEHQEQADAHHEWPLTDGSIPAGIARDSEVASSISTHEAGSLKHITVSATAPPSPAVNDLWVDIS
jgi:hypothetical protein